MKYIYEPEMKNAIDQVISVFSDYIRECPYFDLLWSDKVGYIFISVDIKHGTAGDWDTWVVETAEELLDKILFEFAADILENSGHAIAPCEASQIERAEIERQLMPYLEKLPEYLGRLPRVFADGKA